MKIKLKERADLQEIANEAYAIATDHIDCREIAEARAFIAGLTAGFELGKDGDSQMQEKVEALICDLIVDTMNLRALLEVLEGEG